MYFRDVKKDYEVVKQKVQCTKCFSDDIRKVDDKYICVTCGKEYIVNNEM